MTTPEPFLHHIPLCVDLDGTVTRRDTLWISMFQGLRKAPSLLTKIPYWYFRYGRSILKSRLAEHYLPCPTRLDYYDEFLDYLRIQKERQRRLILVTGAHRLIAEAVSDYLGLFDECLGTVPGTNLSGKTKRDYLLQRFGEQGFDYAGNHRVDLPIWQVARTVIIVNASPLVRKEAERIGRTEVVFS
jgi:phosphoserine phosphatase